MAVLRYRDCTNRKLAAAIGYKENTVSLVLRGRIRPSPLFRAKVAAYLDLPEACLFRDDRPAGAA